MSTAARPTWLPAMGGFTLKDKGIQSKLVSARALAAHTKIGQNAPEEMAQKEKLGQEEEKGRIPTEETEAETEIPEEILPTLALDAGDSESEEESESEESSENDEDDTDELLQELAKIKAERERERQEKEAQKEQEEREKLENEALAGNPLMQQEFGVKRRWDADIIFRNQSKGEIQPKKRFINDLTRSDFHRKFMSRYMK